MIVPDKNFIVVKPDPISEFKLDSGIIVTNPRTKTRDGLVISVGENVQGINEGDRVIFWSSNCPEIDGFLMVNTSDEDCKVIAVYGKN